MTEPPYVDRCSFCGASEAARLWAPVHDTVDRTFACRAEGSKIVTPGPSMTVEKFLQLLQKSGLDQSCDAVRLNALKNEETVTGLVSALVTDGMLTAWQCEKLLCGQYKSFFLNQYEVLEALSPREFRRVFLARQVVTHQRVAIEILPRELHGRVPLVTMLLSRIRSLSAIEYPGIAQVLDADLAGEIRYIVREHVNSANLREVIEALGPMPCEVAVTICAQTALTLAHAHAIGYAFGCLHPNEILLSANQPTKLAALGLPPEPDAFAFRRLLVREQGAEKYLDPPLASRTVSASAMSDVFSLGAILFLRLQE